MLEFNIYQDIFNKRFTFNSPALFNLGKGFCDNKERIRDHHLIYKKNLLDMQLEDYKYIYNSKTTKQMLFACFVIGIEDNLESIMDGLKDAALVSKAGGGVGFNFGNTRERNALVFGGVCGKASGPVSWIHMYNEMGNSVVQGGTRRAALMGMLYDDHPDIFEFMHCKDEEGVLSKFNISVAVSNNLMDSIINNRPDDHFVFHSRKDGKEVKEIPTGVYKTNAMGEKEMTFMETKDITCGKVWNEICEHAWKRGDPGVFFIDNANYDNILKEDTTGDYIIERTNPCVTGDTLVSTPDGYKHAKDVKVGDYISTLSGPDKVDKIEVNENMPVYKVTMSDGDFVKVTESHKFHAIKKNSENKDYEYISLKDLEVGDYIELSGSILPNNKIETFGMEDYDFGLLIGVLLGNGCVTENAIKLKHVETSFGKEDIEWKNLFENILKKYEDLNHYSSRTNRTANLLVFNSKSTLYKILDKYNFVGGSGTKNIPMEIMNSNKDVLCGLLDGYFSTDGHIGLATDKHNPKISIKSINYDLLRSIRMILLMFDMKSSIYYYKRKENDMYIEGRKVNAKDIYELILISNSIDKFCETIHITNPIKNAKLQKISEKSYGRFSTRKISIKSIEKLEGLHTVYDIHCPTDNWITHGYVSVGCGEQPLPNFTSCNLGSINLNSFLTLSEDKKNLNFNIRELSNQIIRSTYYLDLIIDATSFPVRKIEEKTKNIRPVGLGFMGLTDVAFRCNLSYKSEDFKQLCNLIGSIYASTTLFTTISMIKEKIKNKLPEYKLVEKLFKKNGIDEETIEKTKFEDLIKLLRSSDIPPTTLNALFSLSTFFEIYTNRNKFKEYSNYEEFFKEMLKNISIGNIRNSRRLSIAPVGSTSMIMDASNGIEPLFALSWGRKVVTNDKTDETTIQFSYIYKYLNDEERKKLSSGEKLEGDKYLCANDLSVDDHVDIVGIFANYIDSAISKCVAEGTVIETNFGNIKIENFSDNRVKGQFKDISHKGYKVKDQNGKWVNVRSHYCDGRNKCFILFFENNKCIKCSFTHKFLTDDGFKSASELCREFDLDNNPKVLAKDPDNFENNISLKLIHYEISETLLFDIELDSEDHTYLIDDIITHNTCNLKNSATVDDVKYAYEKAYKLGCKGITIYRDGSRNSQPITRTDNKIEMVKEKDGIRLVNTKRERPKFARGITENVDTSNYGTLYVTLNFDENNDPFEVFITLGKSGNEIASLVDACARLISIALRSNTDIKDLIKTLINMDSSNPWFYDSDKNGEVIMTSIPDAIAKLIIEIMDHKDEVLSNSSNIEKNKNDKFDNATIEMEMLKENSANGGVIECPKCHKITYSIFSGCRICINPDCGYSACDAI